MPDKQQPVEDKTTFEDIEHSLKKAAAAMRDADVPFVLGGSLAAWARGGPQFSKDLDFFVKEEDVERALQALVDAGLTPERPPENWLLKAWDGHVLVDLIHHGRGLPVTDEVIERAEVLNVVAMPMRVLALEDVMTTKLHALTEQSLDYGTLLQIARSLREQIDWSRVRRETADSPYARAFFHLLEELDVIEPEAGRPGGRPQVRVAGEPA